MPSSGKNAVSWNTYWMLVRSALPESEHMPEISAYCLQSYEIEMKKDALFQILLVFLAIFS